MAYYIDYSGMSKREKMNKALKDIEYHTGKNDQFFIGFFLGMIADGLSSRRAADFVANTTSMMCGISGEPIYQLRLFLRVKSRVYRDV